MARKVAIFGASPLGYLGGAAREELLGAAALEPLVEGRALTVEAEVPRALLLIGSGRVRLERARAHAAPPARYPVAHRGPGEMVGEGGLGDGPSLDTAIVADDGDALAIALEPMRRVLASDAAAREVVARALLEQRRAAERRLEALLLHGVEVRLTRLLLEAAARWGVEHAASGVLVTAGFTHAELALLIGSTRETVTLLLGKLRREGLVAFERRRLVIRDRAAL
ncbi:MAG TPA: Crp/Fnr family transcriptional regulator, partial [Minicystis sp.]|nr:Crp/Fnr family transcriptional regulator [Minicystis sp.]